jgi:hypothetical protein
VKKASVNLFSKILSVFILAGLFMFVSCGDDDSVDCNRVVIEIGPIFTAMTEAISSEDCAGIESSYADFIDLVRRGRSCSIIQQTMEDAGYDNIDEYIDALEIERDEFLTDLACD